MEKKSVHPRNFWRLQSWDHEGEGIATRHEAAGPGLPTWIPLLPVMGFLDV